MRLQAGEDLRRSRLTVLLRPLFAVPHVLWYWAWSLAAFSVLVVSWFATLIAGRPQAGMHDFLGRYVRYTIHVFAYLGFVANPFPGFLGVAGSYPVDVEIEGPDRQNRWVTAFRLVLALPAFVLAQVFLWVVFFVAVVGWFVSLALGRTPRGMRDLSAYCLRYEAQTLAYFNLLTARYPTLYVVEP